MNEKNNTSKLQEEIDHILANVDEKTLFAEFRQEEIFDIQKGDRQAIIHHTLDERILSRNSSYNRPNSTTFKILRIIKNGFQKM